MRFTNTSSAKESFIARKNGNLPKHTDIDIKNLYFTKACQSLTSRDYLKTQFAWQFYYHTLITEGTGQSVEFNRVENR